MSLSLIDIHSLWFLFFLFNIVSLLNSLFLQELLAQHNMTPSLKLVIVPWLIIITNPPLLFDILLHPLLIDIIRVLFSILVLILILTIEPVPLVLFEIMMMSPHLLFLLFLLFLQTLLLLFRVVFYVLFCQVLMAIIAIADMSGSKVVYFLLRQFNKVMLGCFVLEMG